MAQKYAVYKLKKRCYNTYGQNVTKNVLVIVVFDKKSKERNGKGIIL